MEKEQVLTKERKKVDNLKPFMFFQLRLGCYLHFYKGLAFSFFIEGRTDEQNKMWQYGVQQLEGVYSNEDLSWDSTKFVGFLKNKVLFESNKFLNKMKKVYLFELEELILYAESVREALFNNKNIICKTAKKNELPITIPKELESLYNSKVYGISFKDFYWQIMKGNSIHSDLVYQYILNEIKTVKYAINEIFPISRVSLSSESVYTQELQNSSSGEKTNKAHLVRCLFEMVTTIGATHDRTTVAKLAFYLINGKEASNKKEYQTLLNAISAENKQPNNETSKAEKETIKSYLQALNLLKEK